MTTLTSTPWQMPGVVLGPENPLPHFRDRDHNRHVAVHESLPAAKRQRLGDACGTRVLPYRMQDDYTRQRTPQTYTAIVLENDILKATFMPQLGGRLWSLVYKPQQRELLNCNPVFQPANLAIRNAWFAGGIEWNMGHYGHTFGTCAPVFAATIHDSDGTPGLRLYEYERCTGVFWQIDFYLPPASPWLIAHTRIHNPHDHATSMYWWSNTAVDERPDVRVLAPTNHVIYTDLTVQPAQFGYADMPHLATFRQQDASYSTNAHAASEYFFQPDDVDMPWEAALGGDGTGFIEASTARLRYRKMFCWGMHQGGRHWQEFLAPGGKPYLEIQAGLAPSQLHGLEMPAQTDWHWTQVFGYFQGDATIVHHPDWQTAWRGVDAALKERLPVERLSALDHHYTALAERAPSTILQHGSGWGALEVARRHAQAAPTVPAAFTFPTDTLTSAQQPWLNLLAHGHFADADPQNQPGEWMVQPAWQQLLATHPDTATNWYALLHLGVMHLEAGDTAAAQAAWQSSLASAPSAWAWRNLAIIAQHTGDYQQASHCLAQAWQLKPDTLAIAHEYLEALCVVQDFEQARQVYHQLPHHLRQHDRILIVWARIALALQDFDTVADLLDHEYAVVREGETSLTDIWFALCYQREVQQLGHPLSESEQIAVRQRNPPPDHIDFRSINT